MQRRIVEYQTGENRISSRLSKDFNDCLSGVRVQVVIHQIDRLCQWIQFIHQVAHGFCKVFLCPTQCDQHMTLSRVRFNEQKDVPGTLTDILVITSARAARLRWRSQTAIRQQLQAFLVKTYGRTQRIIGTPVQGQHIFQVSQELRRDLCMAPTLDLPGLNFVFCNACRTVSGATGLISSRRIASSASNRTVQRHRPCGGSLQASATTRVSSSSLSLCGAPQRESSCRQSITPRSILRNRIRRTVSVLVSKACAISSSVHPSALRRRTWARIMTRAECSPVVMISCNSLRCLTLRRIDCLSGMRPSLLCRTF
jgi:hypothetical protein